VLYRLKNSAQTDGRTDGQTDRRTDDITISVEPIFLKMCSKKTKFNKKNITWSQKSKMVVKNQNDAKRVNFY
jgi:hypothetical protein